MPDSPRDFRQVYLILRKGAPRLTYQPEVSSLTLSELGVLNVVKRAGIRNQRRINEDGKYGGPDFDREMG
jgi:hypothetical protein